MSMTAEAAAVSPREGAGRDGEAVAIAVMGTVNVAIAQLVAAIRDLVASDGWGGAGIRSPEHWVTWKAGVAHARAAGLVRIARRAGDLPATPTNAPWSCSTTTSTPTAPSAPANSTWAPPCPTPSPGSCPATPRSRS